jgi:dihydroxyacetone kinase-like protein
MNLTKERFVEMMAAGLKAVEADKDELSALDSATGDGDHGIAICEAMNAAVEAAGPDTDFKPTLTDMGFAIMTATGGSTSTLLGALLLGMADGVEQKELSAAETVAMFRCGLENVRKQTRADVGDKTMMDALIPAVSALEAHQDEGLVEMFTKAAAAADEGRINTAGMMAKFGRARNLGERVVGHVDAGAASMACIFKAFAETIQTNREEQDNGGFG